MTTFVHGPIVEIQTAAPNVYAFRIIGHMTEDDTEALAKYVGTAFDKPGKVSMLLDLSGMTGRDLDAMFDGDVSKTNLRSLRGTEKYAVVGAPDFAARMIGWFDRVIPVDAQAFDTIDEAWAFLGTRPVVPTS